jgi:GMP synthase-like glutamine amidotransferase
MSVNDEAEWPWLPAEKRLIREAIGAGTPVLGVCLGAQLIANALGARVYRNAVKEIGWHPIQAVTPSSPAFRFPAERTVFHWHGETFDLPEGAVHLAKSRAAENQAFQVGRRAIGLQFHLETTPAAAEALLEHCRHELTPGPYVQSEGEIRSTPCSWYQEINRLMSEVLGYLVEPG